MAQQFNYNYAVIDENGMCIEVYSDSHGHDELPADHVEIPECNGNYLFKYYNRADGKWYYDADFTNEWIPE